MSWNHSVHKQLTKMSSNDNLSDSYKCHSIKSVDHHCVYQFGSHSIRSKCCFQWIINFIIISSLLSFAVTSPSHRDKDEINETICKPVPEERISFVCPENMKMIIRESYFSTYLNNNPHCQQNHVQRNNLPDCYEDLRLPIIAKCTSANCSFTHKEMMSQCSGPGHILLKYSCIQTYLLAHYCNSNMDRPYGYISSPTYPDYAVDVKDCNWYINATEGQTIELQVLDLQLTGPQLEKAATLIDPAVYKCEEAALIIEADQRSDSFCGTDITNLKTFKTKGPWIKLSYKQEQFRATRGWLLRYQVNGCPKLKDPFKGHIVEQNETSAIISCCEGYIFKDTRESKKYLTCLRNNWDGTVSSCVRIADIDAPESSESSNSVEQDIDNNIVDSDRLPAGHQLSKPIEETQKALFSDFVIPISLMVLLVVVVVIFIVTIVKCRSRRSKATLLTYTHEASVPLTNTSPVNV